MLDVAFRRFDQVRNQVVAALELHVDLCEGIFKAVPQGHEPVVLTDGKERRDNNKCDNRQEDDEENGAEACKDHVVILLRDGAARNCENRGGIKCKSGCPLFLDPEN